VRPRPRPRLRRTGPERTQEVASGARPVARPCGSSSLHSIRAILLSVVAKGLVLLPAGGVKVLHRLKPRWCLARDAAGRVTEPFRTTLQGCTAARVRSLEPYMTSNQAHLHRAAYVFPEAISWEVLRDLACLVPVLRAIAVNTRQGRVRQFFWSFVGRLVRVRFRRSIQCVGDRIVGCG